MVLSLVKPIKKNHGQLIYADIRVHVDQMIRFIFQKISKDSKNMTMLSDG